MKKNYYLFMVLALGCVNFINAQFVCPELLGNQTTATIIHYKIPAGTCAEYSAAIFVSDGAFSETFNLLSCNGTNLKYTYLSGDPLVVADTFIAFFTDPDTGQVLGICGYENGVYNPILSNNDVTLNESISIFPNPLRKDNILTIKLATNISAKVFMYDVTGKLTITDEIDNVTRKQINTSVLNNGVYFLQIVTDNASITRKVVIMQ